MKWGPNAVGCRELGTCALRKSIVLVVPTTRGNSAGQKGEVGGGTPYIAGHNGITRPKQKVKRNKSLRAVKGNPKREKLLWTQKPSPRLGLTRNGTNATRSALSYLLSNHHLRRLNSKMKLPMFIRKNRSKARSEISLVEGQSEVDPAAPRPTESTPDPLVGTSISPAPGPLTPRDQEPNGMQTVLFRCIHLNPSLRMTDTNIDSDRILPVPGRDESSPPEPSGHTTDTGAVSESGWGRDTTAYNATRFLIRAVQESSDAFPPLKSVAGGLSAILDHCEVRLLQTTPPVVLNVVPENKRVWQSDGVVGAPSRTVGRIVERTGS